MLNAIILKKEITVLTNSRYQLKLYLEILLGMVLCPSDLRLNTGLKLSECVGLKTYNCDNMELWGEGESFYFRIIIESETYTHIAIPLQLQYFNRWAKNSFTYQLLNISSSLRKEKIFAKYETKSHHLCATQRLHFPVSDSSLILR